MKDLFTGALHIFIIIMMAVFVIGGVLAVTGSFDHWGSRYVLKRRRRRLLRNGRAQLRNTPPTQLPDNKPKVVVPDRKNTSYKGKYA